MKIINKKEMNKEKLIRVYFKVVSDIKNGYYINSFDEKIDFPEPSESPVFYSHTSDTSHLPGPHFSKTRIYVENKDTFQKALELGDNCAVLNMASQRRPGGGVSSGSRAQEEELCRRSNLYKSLVSFSDLGPRLFNTPESKIKYPIPYSGGIYSPEVCIYRKPKTYLTYQEPSITNVITVSAINKPDLDSDFSNRMSSKSVSITKTKIRTILRIAIIHGNTKLVLGAFGCGAFHNPPRHMAELFSEVLSESEFSDRFEEICFAILDDNNTGRSHNPEGNFKPFLDVFGGKR